MGCLEKYHAAAGHGCGRAALAANDTACFRASSIDSTGTAADRTAFRPLALRTAAEFMNALSLTQRNQRALLIALSMSAFALAWLLDPVHAEHRLPFSLSCHAALGVPCLCCGMTRAFHFLLHGDMATAIYFNWLVIPCALAAMTLLAVIATEICLGRRLLDFPFALTARRLTFALVFIACLWTTNVYLAVSQRKMELLNPDGPLYSLLVR